MQFVQEPVIEAVNITEYYYNYQHRVPVKINGSNFDSHIDPLMPTRRKIYVRVEDTKIESFLLPGSASFEFFMPLALNLGTYRLSVSTDGLFYRPQE